MELKSTPPRYCDFRCLLSQKAWNKNFKYVWCVFVSSFSLVITKSKSTCLKICRDDIGHCECARYLASFVLMHASEEYWKTLIIFHITRLKTLIQLSLYIWLNSFFSLSANMAGLQGIFSSSFSISLALTHSLSSRHNTIRYV